jgi:hypothetical protein
MVVDDVLLATSMRDRIAAGWDTDIIVTYQYLASSRHLHTNIAGSTSHPYDVLFYSETLVGNKGSTTSYFDPYCPIGICEDLVTLDSTLDSVAVSSTG